MKWEENSVYFPEIILKSPNTTKKIRIVGYYCFALGDFSTAFEMMAGVYLSQEILRVLKPLKDSNGWILAKGWYCIDLRDFSTALEMVVKAVDSDTIALGEYSDANEF